MDLIADILLGAGAIGAAVYCMVLSRRLQRLTQLESGMGGAIAVLSAQVDDLTRTLGRAETAARASSDTLDERTRRAEEAVQRLELLISTLHDLPDPVRQSPPPAAPSAPEPHPTAAAEARPRTVRRRARRSLRELAEEDA